MKKGMWILMMIACGALAVWLFTWVTMLLWNWLVPVLFAGPVISFWQAMGLLALSKILFWSFGKGGHYGGRHWGGHWRGHYWKQKWATMTPEEREKFKQKMMDKWCYRQPAETQTKESGAANV